MSRRCRESQGLRLGGEVVNSREAGMSLRHIRKGSAVQAGDRQPCG
jgi:hypothetical protein